METKKMTSSYHRLRRNHYYFATKYCIFNGSDYDRIATHMPPQVDANLVRQVNQEFMEYTASHSKMTYPFRPSEGLQDHIEVVQSVRPERAARDLVKSYLQHKVDNFLEPETQPVRITQQSGEQEVVTSFPRVYTVRVLDVRADENGEEILDMEVSVSTELGADGNPINRGAGDDEAVHARTDTLRTFYGIPRKHILVHTDIKKNIAAMKDDINDPFVNLPPELQNQLQSQKVNFENTNNIDVVSYMRDIFGSLQSLSSLKRPLVVRELDEHDRREVRHDGFNSPTVPAQVTLALLDRQRWGDKDFPLDKFFLKDEAQFFVEQWNLHNPPQMEKGETYQCSIFFETELVYVQFFKLQPTFQLYEYYVSRKDFLTSQNRFTDRKDLSTRFGAVTTRRQQQATQATQAAQEATQAAKTPASPKSPQKRLAKIKKKTTKKTVTLDLEVLRHVLSDMRHVFRYIVKSAFQPFEKDGNEVRFAYNQEDAVANGMTTRQYTRLDKLFRRNDEPCKQKRVVIHSEVPWDASIIPESFELEDGDFVRVNVTLQNAQGPSSHVGIVVNRTIKRKNRQARKRRDELNEHQDVLFTHVLVEGTYYLIDDSLRNIVVDGDEGVAMVDNGNNVIDRSFFSDDYFVLPSRAEITDLVFADPYFSSENLSDKELIAKVQKLVKASRDQFFAGDRVIRNLGRSDDSALATLSAWLRNRWFLVVLYNLFMHFHGAAGFKFTASDAIFELLVLGYRNLHRHTSLEPDVSDLRTASSFLVDQGTVNTALGTKTLNKTRFFVRNVQTDPSGYCHAADEPNDEADNYFDMRNQIPSFDQLYRFRTEKATTKKVVSHNPFNRTQYVQEHIQQMRWFLNLDQTKQRRRLARRRKGRPSIEPGQLRDMEIQTFFQRQNQNQGRAVIDSIKAFEEARRGKKRARKLSSSGAGASSFGSVVVPQAVLDFIF
jgi:hypothetical protein